MRAYEDTANSTQNLAALFAIHEEFTWEENLARLVDATNAIAGTGVRFEPTKEQRNRILNSVDVANAVLSDQSYMSLQTRLSGSVQAVRKEILAAAEIDNVNVRGNRIEQLITQAGNLHLAEDIVEALDSGITVKIDVKTKLADRVSSPKAYNIDKMLTTLAEGDTIFCFLFIGMDLVHQTVTSRLISIVDATMLAATRIQFHWAGRNSRGVTQLTGDLSQVLQADFHESVPIEAAKAFLAGLIDLRPVGVE